MRDWCDAAGLPGCSLHGLRKAGARRLIEYGCTEAEVAAWGGWDSIKEVQRYIRQYNRRKAVWAAAAKLPGGTVGKQNLQTGSEKLTNPGSN